MPDDEAIAAILATRGLTTEGAFITPYLRPGLAVLDCGCGPGSISIDIANNLAPGTVIGIDIDHVRIEHARAASREHGIANVSFESADVHSLPFDDASFDLVFSNALMQHLPNPESAVAEMYRVLRPAGILALRSPDWGALFVTPRNPTLMECFSVFLQAYYRNGDPYAGSNMSLHAANAGFQKISVNVVVTRESPAALSEFISMRLEEAGLPMAAERITAWGREETAYFAQTWGEVTAMKKS